MLKTVKDACKLHESTLDYQAAGGVENLAQVISAPDKGREFFEKKSYDTRHGRSFVPRASPVVRQVGPGAV